jgi:hypothetical protein
VVELVVAGAAGHGKTSLIEALDPPGSVSVTDAGTHEGLLGAMIAAGPPGIDLSLLAVAADHGITDQTREHVALLRALGVDHGLVVVTRADLADQTRVLREIDQLIPGTRAHAVSLTRGDGLGALRTAFAALLAGLPARVEPPAARLAAGGSPHETRVIDAALDFGPHREREPEHGAEVVVHLRGSHAAARLARLGGRFWQVRLAAALRAAAGDRFVVRAAGRTLGGGVVLDPCARRHPTSNELIVRLTRISRGEPPLPPEPPRSGRTRIS